MAYFNQDWITELVVDASPSGLGAVLTQHNPDNPRECHEVANASRMLSDVERRYSQCEKEGLAAVWGCERFWVYLMGKPFKLVTENRAIALIFASTTTRPPARIERLALRLSQFQYEIVHRPGHTNIADYYSRHAGKNSSTVFLEEAKRESEKLEAQINRLVRENLPLAITVRDVAEATRRDQEMQKLIATLGSDTRKSKLPTDLAEYQHVFSELSLSSEGILLRGDRILIPRDLRVKVLDLAHAGHQGIVKTKSLIRSKVWYPGIDKQVERRSAHEGSARQMLTHVPTNR